MRIPDLLGARITGNNYFGIVLQSQLKLSPISYFFLICHLPKTIIQSCIRGTLKCLLFYLAYWPKTYKEIPNKMSGQTNQLKFKMSGFNSRMSSLKIKVQRYNNRVLMALLGHADRGLLMIGWFRSRSVWNLYI